MVPNPLLKIHLNWWESYLVSHAFGKDWQSNIWNNAISAIDTWMMMNEKPATDEIEAFVMAHINQFITFVSHGNMFIGAGLSAILMPIVNIMMQSLVSYAEYKLGLNKVVTPMPSVNTVPVSANNAPSVAAVVTTNTTGTATETKP